MGSGLGKGNLLVEVKDPAVHPDPHIPLLEVLFKELLELAFSSLHHRRQNHDSRVLRVGQDRVDDLIQALVRDRPPAQMTVRLADGGKQQAHVVVDLGDRADGGAGAAAGGLLLDADGRRQAFHAVHVRLLHLLEELARKCGKRLDVAALAFGIDRVEGQAGLARTGEPGNHRQLLSRNLQIDVLQVVLARAAHHYLLQHSQTKLLILRLRVRQRQRRPQRRVQLEVGLSCLPALS